MSLIDELTRVNMLMLECLRVLRRPSEDNSNDKEAADIMLSLNALSTQIAGIVQEHIARRQVCPGPYWRQDIEFQKRIQEKNQTKKRKTNPKTVCTAVNLEFDKGGQGPPREDDGPRRLCNLCYQTFFRDQGAGLF